MQLLRQIAVTYNDRGPNKGLPKCGTLFASRPEALAGHWQQWVVVNLVLFLLPGMTACLILPHSLFYRAIPASISDPFTIAWNLVFFSGVSGSSLVFIGDLSGAVQFIF
ncbi:hypothetical protein B0H17DRAFT_1139878 [Mycena rosella]|uniref:Uncharacterized protein n=1 Tax=Mycena rosella TaxID=1033263 RepID=A0AAD7D3K4_MYCRO|nr:hypothetical protein B0H17DRAFT_1139878 [Mycena rosella]